MNWNYQCFEIIALDPNPASRRQDCLTHPHVKDEVVLRRQRRKSLINKALEDGRLADAFILVRSVLVTYNADSPHVSLDAGTAANATIAGTCLSETMSGSAIAVTTTRCDDCIKECVGATPIAVLPA